MSDLLHWHYGVMEYERDNSGEPEYSVCEIYVDDDGVKSWTAEPVTLHASSVKELIDVLRQVIADVEMAVPPSKRHEYLVAVQEGVADDE